MTLSPLQISTNDSAPVLQVDGPKSCSPRSMYSLATAVGISCEKVVLADTSNSSGSVALGRSPWRTSSPSSQFPTSHENSFPHSLQGEPLAIRVSPAARLFLCLNAPQPRSHHGDRNRILPQKCHRQGPEVANGLLPKCKIWGSPVLFHDAEFGLRWTFWQDVPQTVFLKSQPW